MPKEIKTIGLKKSDIVNSDPCNFAGSPTAKANPYGSDIKCLKNAKYALATAHFAPNSASIIRSIYKQFPELHPKFVKEPEIAMLVVEPKKAELKKKIKKLSFKVSGKSKKKRSKRRKK